MKRAIVVIGGYNSLWPSYLKLARDLEDLTGLPAIGVPLMPWHWWQAGRQDRGTVILDEIRGTVNWARRKFGAERFILVGHSAGGVAARLYLYDGPLWGQAYGGVEHVDAVITLGSPHCTHRWGETGWYLIDTANHLVPNTYYDQVAYYPVMGRYIQGSQDGSLKERRAFRMYRFLDGQGVTWGDGMIPLHCADLAGVETLVLDRVAHSAKVGRAWYGGSARIVRRWWPGELSGLGQAPREEARGG